MGALDASLALQLRARHIFETSLGPGHPETAVSLNLLAELYRAQAVFSKAESLYKEVLRIRESTLGEMHLETATSLTNLAKLYRSTGAYDKALPLMNRALLIRARLLGEMHVETAQAYNNLGSLYKELHDVPRAEEHMRQGLHIRKNVLGDNHSSTAVSHNNLGQLLWAAKRYEESETEFRDALRIKEATLGAEHPETARTLGSLGQVVAAQGRFKEAEKQYQRALGILLAVAQPEVTWTIYNNLMLFYRQLPVPQPALAIFYGKLAVNEIQKVRAQNVDMHRSLQTAFLEQNENTYRALIDLLLSEYRIAEARQVLMMLKEDEYFRFVDQNVKLDPRKTRATLSSLEAPWLDRLTGISNAMAVHSTERRELSRQSPLRRGDAGAARLQELQDELEAHQSDLDIALSGLSNELRDATQVATLPPEQAGRLQQTLSTLGRGAVAVQYIKTDQRLWILLTSPTVELARPISVQSAELDQLIVVFRNQITRLDPSHQVTAKQLHDLLIAPVAAELSGMDSRTLMLSLDGSLRYLPMAALHDGKSFLIERYSISLYNEIADRALLKPPQDPWSMEAFGSSKAHAGFSALPAVRGELNGIVPSVMKGSAVLDAAFTRPRLLSSLRHKAPVLHIASHFYFRPGSYQESFLLLGDGNRLTLEQLTDLSFEGIDLLSLSACETAVGGGRDMDGREVESFGVLAQRRGAHAVLATLWQVADTSTAQLMRTFYLTRQTQEGTTKADALRQAQLNFLNMRTVTEDTPSPSSGTRSAARRIQYTAPSSTDGRQRPQPYAHPYYWAPFILMGNWL